MGYGPAALAAQAGGVSTYDTVFVEPASAAAFEQTGVWPDGTTFVLEIRTAEHTGSIVTRGHYQTELVGLEAEIKDARIPGGWGFFAFQGDGPAKRLPGTASCYGCHAASGAVENTFTQFYPTLFPIAQAKGTVRRDFVGIPPGAREVTEVIVARGFAAGRELIDRAIERWPEATLASEFVLNRVGYALVAEKRIDLAIAMFADVARRWPDSANAWDSLAETYEAAGNADEARAATEKGIVALARMAPGGQRDALEKALHERAARLH